MDWTDNPELVRAHLAGEPPRPKDVAHLDEMVSVLVSRCECGWFEYAKVGSKTPDKCGRCGTELPPA